MLHLKALRPLAGLGGVLQDVFEAYTYTYNM